MERSPCWNLAAAHRAGTADRLGEIALEAGCARIVLEQRRLQGGVRVGPLRRAADGRLGQQRRQRVHYRVDILHALQLEDEGLAERDNAQERLPLCPLLICRRM